MSIQQMFPMIVQLQGDGVSTTFVFAIRNVCQVGNPSLPTGFSAVVPSAVTVNNPPFPITSVVVDANGNITLTLTSALANGQTAAFEIDLFYNSNLSPATYPNIAQNSDVSSVAGVPTVTAASGVQKVGIVGNAGAVFDAVTGAVVPANAVQVGASDGTDLQPLSINVKGTQGARGLAVQELKDSGRTYLSFVLDGGNAPTTEALASLAINKGGTTTAAQTTYTVTAGKTLRLQSVTANLSSGSGTQTIKVRIRAAATVSVASSIVWTGVGIGPSGTPNQIVADWPDGIEIAGGQQIGISLVSGNANNTTTVSLNGYEY